MFEMSPRSMEALVGKQETFSDGTKVEATFINRADIDPNPSSAAVAEARHIALNPNNVRSASIDNEGGGVTDLIRFDGVQFAAHREGNGHDRMVSEYMGEDYDRNTQVANMRLSGKQREIAYLAGGLQRRRKISRGEAFDLINRAKTGEDVEVTVISPDGTKVTKRETGVKGQTVIIDFMQILKEKQEKRDDKNKGGTFFQPTSQSETSTDQLGSQDVLSEDEGVERRNGLIFQIPVQHEIPADQVDGQGDLPNAKGEDEGNITRLPVRSSTEDELTKVREQLANLQEAA